MFLTRDATVAQNVVHRGRGVGDPHEIDQVVGDRRGEHAADDGQPGAQLGVELGRSTGATVIATSWSTRASAVR